MAWQLPVLGASQRLPAHPLLNAMTMEALDHLDENLAAVHHGGVLEDRS